VVAFESFYHFYTDILKMNQRLANFKKTPTYNDKNRASELTLLALTRLPETLLKEFETVQLHPLNFFHSSFSASYFNVHDKVAQQPFQPEKIGAQTIRLMGPP
jgi:hypothetical protein